MLDTDAAEDISGTLDGATTSFRATITPSTNHRDRVADTVTVTAYSGTVGDATEEASLTFTLADAHAVPAAAAVTVEARDTAGRVVTAVAKGRAVDLTVSVDRGQGAAGAPGEALSVALALAADAAQASSYRLAPALVDLPAVTPAGKQNGDDSRAARDAGRRVCQRRPADPRPGDHRRGRLRAGLGREQLRHRGRRHDGKAGVGEAGRGGEGGVRTPRAPRPRAPTA